MFIYGPCSVFVISLLYFLHCITSYVSHSHMYALSLYFMLFLLFLTLTFFLFPQCFFLHLQLAALLQFITLSVSEFFFFPYFLVSFPFLFRLFFSCLVFIFISALTFLFLLLLCIYFPPSPIMFLLLFQLFKSILGAVTTLLQHL